VVLFNLVSIFRQKNGVRVAVGFFGRVWILPVFFFFRTALGRFFTRGFGVLFVLGIQSVLLVPLLFFSFVQLVGDRVLFFGGIYLFYVGLSP
jgi:hypothetical protein